MASYTRALVWVAFTTATAASNEENVAWLEKNANEAGVVTLPSGLQYKVLASGPETGAHPGVSTPCTCHYEGSLIDGTVFDSSRKRGSPATFAPNRVIGGWTEALQLMRPGDRWKLYIPAKLGYGARGAGGRIPGGATLVFDLELISLSESGGGFFSGFGLSFLDMEILGPVKVWMALLGGIYMFLRGSFGGDSGGKKVTASHILVKEESLCADLKAKLASGSEKFEALAKAHSTCPSGKSGGSLGTFSPGQMVPAFDKVCWSAPIGEVQGPVQTQFGYHLILVTERNDPSEGAADKKQ